MDIKTYRGESYTDLGTKIVKPGQEMDKNAFLTILAAQLSNLDPTQDIDSTQYVSQLAQFASMEQMTNLNTTMSDYSNRNLVGKGVTVSNTNSQGVKYSGIVAGVTTQGGTGYISMIVNENGVNVYKDFPIENVETVLQVTDSNIALNSSINVNIQYMFASSLIGKDVEITDVDSEGNSKDPVNGNVIGAYKENGVIYVKVKLSTGDTASYSYDKITKVGDVSK